MWGKTHGYKEPSCTQGLYGNTGGATWQHGGTGAWRRAGGYVATKEGGDLASKERGFMAMRNGDTSHPTDCLVIDHENSRILGMNFVCLEWGNHRPRKPSMGGS